VTPAQAEVAGEIERAYPGYHVWTSDEGYWYATRARPRARGISPTVCGADPGELTCELSAEEAAISRAHQAAMASPAPTVKDPPPLPPGWSGSSMPSRLRSRLFLE
jgi:hypothetical protein